MYRNKVLPLLKLIPNNSRDHLTRNKNYLINVNPTHNLAPHEFPIIKKAKKLKKKLEKHYSQRKIWNRIRIKHLTSSSKSLLSLFLKNFLTNMHFKLEKSYYDENEYYFNEYY